MSKLLLKRIIAGGQTGCDQAAILTANALNYETGGWAPLGFRTESGPAPWLADFGLTEWHTDNYIDRTVANVARADATVIFGKRSVGSNRTEESARRQGRPCLWIPVTVDDRLRLPIVRHGSWKDLAWFLSKNDVRTLNCAGNRESVMPGIQEAVSEFLMEALPPLT